MTDVFNLFDGQLDDELERPGWSWRRAIVGDKIGAEKLGASLYELEPNEKTFPYHYEYGAEEWLLVVGGRPTLRAPDGEHVLRPGDIVCFREGPDGAHQVRNDTDASVRVLIFSTKGVPAVPVYPDSGKIGISTGSQADPLRYFRIDSSVDYCDGETA